MFRVNDQVIHRKMQIIGKVVDASLYQTIKVEISPKLPHQTWAVGDCYLWDPAKEHLKSFMPGESFTEPGPASA
jgi:hypothetical protein